MALPVVAVIIVVQAEGEAQGLARGQRAGAQALSGDGHLQRPAAAERARESGDHRSVLAKIGDAAVETEGELVVIGAPADVIVEAVNAQLDAVVPPDVGAVGDQ